MNWLSWLIYLSEVCEKFGGFCVSLALLCAVLIFALALIYAASEGEVNLLPKYLSRLVAGGVIFGTISCFVPSQKTVLMIAGSEAAAMVAMSPDAREMLGDLKDVIQGRLRELKSNSEKK